MKAFLIRLVVIITFFILLLTPKISIEGARSGLTLWANTVVPSLLPSMILTSFLVRIRATSMISKVVSPVFSRAFKLSREGCFCIVSGIFCGYPMGVKTANDLLCENRIDVSEARLLMYMCSYPSPMFLVGYVINDRLKSPQILPLYLTATYLPPVIFGMIMGRRHLTHYEKPKTRRSPVSIRFAVLEECVAGSCEIIIGIGAFMMLFSILSQWIKNLPLLSGQIKLITSVLLEMTTGVNLIVKSDLAPDCRVAACVFATSFGGLCTFAQCCSVLRDDRLSKSGYLAAKLIHGLTSAALYLLLVRIRILVAL